MSQRVSHWLYCWLSPYADKFHIIHKSAEAGVFSINLNKAARKVDRLYVEPLRLAPENSRDLGGVGDTLRLAKCDRAAEQADTADTDGRERDRLTCVR